MILGIVIWSVVRVVLMLSVWMSWCIGSGYWYVVDLVLWASGGWCIMYELVFG